MKSKIFYLLIAFVLVHLGSPVGFAQTPTPKTSTTPQPTRESITNTLSEQITNLKEKIASHVAELNLVEKRGIIGETTEVDDTQITLTDIYGKTRFVDVDELTEFESDDDDNSFGISDIKPKMTISVLGPYNKETERVLARFVRVISVPLFVNGNVSAIDDDEFTIDVQTTNGKTYTIDVERSTITQEYADDGLKKSGFTQFEEGQRVFVMGFEDENEENRMSASRILIYTGDEPEEKQNAKTTPTPTTSTDE